MRQIQILNRHKSLQYKTSKLRDFLKGVDDCLRGRLPAGEISVVFLPSSEMCQVHSDFFNDPSLTDVMTFPGDEPDFCGEICVSPDQAVMNAKKEGTSLSFEISLYLVHGFLHLTGLSDLTTEEKQLMRKAEKEVLENPLIAGLLPDFSIASCPGNK